MTSQPSPLDRFRALFNIVPNRLRVTLSVEKLESFLTTALAEEYARGGRTVAEGFLLLLEKMPEEIEFEQMAQLVRATTLYAKCIIESARTHEN